MFFFHFLSRDFGRSERALRDLIKSVSIISIMSDIFECRAGDHATEFRSVPSLKTAFAVPHTSVELLSSLS